MHSLALRCLLHLLCALAIVSPCTAHASTISEYKPVSVPCRGPNGNQLHAIRSFIKDGVPHYLLVDAHTLQPSVQPLSSVNRSDGLAVNPITRLLAKTDSPPFKLQNHGLKHSMIPVSGMFLTVDLCPSRRPFETPLFEALASLANTTRKPVPVAICISGAWLSSHRDEVEWLKDQERKGAIAITWVNHSLSHFYEPNLLLERNFMLSEGTNQRMEILANEVAMIGAGLTPSPFFRFPGLVADETLIRLLGELSLIPLGADAWLAKGEMPREGSIILVHGNGNEPSGIAKLMKLLQNSPCPDFLPLYSAILPVNHKSLDKPALTGQR